jgi:hypothetical protein
MNGRSWWKTLLVACVAVSVVASPAAASKQDRLSFTGNVCGLFTAKQIAVIVGDTKPSKYACAPGKSVKTRAGATYSAHAGSGTVAGGGFFAIQLVKYANPKTEALVANQYKTVMKPVAGIGDWCYSRIAVSPVFGGTADNGQFAFGARGYGVLINVRAVLKKTVKQSALKSLAKEIVAEL